MDEKINEYAKSKDEIETLKKSQMAKMFRLFYNNNNLFKNFNFKT